METMKKKGTTALFLAATILISACSGDHGTNPGRSSDTYSPAVPASLMPPELAWDFYPHNLTREHLLARLSEAVPKSGILTGDETWSGTVHVTGDVVVNRGLTLTIKAGTWVLVAARSDDWGVGGDEGEVDQFNPRDPPKRPSERSEIRIHGSLEVLGTRELPVIITSDAVKPENDDWSGMLLAPDEGGAVEINRAIIEFGRYIGISSAEVTIRQSILRNMMGCVVIGFDMSAVLDHVPLELTPTLTQNHIYNTGRNAVTIRSGAPVITHNVIRARPDMDTTGWEQGAIATYAPTCVVIRYNYLDGGQPKPYRGEIFGEYKEYSEPQCVGLRGVCDLTFSFNTVTGSPLALETHAGTWSIEHNNLLPVPAPEPVAPTWLSGGSCLAVVARDWRPEPGDIYQIEFLEQMGGLPLADVVTVPYNYWGTADPSKIEQMLWSDSSERDFDYEPVEEAFIAEAMPNWRGFMW